MKRFLAALLLFTTTVVAQQFDPALYREMRWRMIGPFRGGRTVPMVGVASQPNVFYIGVNNGGVFKTTDAGRTWSSIFDDQPTQSVGAVAVAPSDPNTIYVGSGEGLQRPDLSVGDGIYRTSDGGKTWQHVGVNGGALRDGQQIAQIIVDPKNPNRVFVAVLGHPYGPNAERGVFRSVDGGKTFEKVLYKDANTGAVDLAFDPANAQTVYAVLWAQRLAPWENGVWQGKTSGLYKSTDGGSTWRQLTKGLPGAADDLGRIGLGVAPSNGKIIYAMVDAPKLAGVYRSDDAGESWQRVNSDARVSERGSDFAEIKPDPKNPEIVYVAGIQAFRSADGGKTFVGWKGAPGGDDYHRIWINPEHPEIVAIASDQGATITVNGGASWSSWYNQPSAQFYHVITDNQFPYWVYGGQQESGSAAVKSRGDSGAITFRDWHPVGVEEYGYVAPDPRDPSIIYGGKASRYDARTGQTQDIAPEAVRSGKYRFLRTEPILFSPKEPGTLYLAGNVLFKTTDGGHSWSVISPDLSRPEPGVPQNFAVFTQDGHKVDRRGVIYAVAPSFQDVNVIWAGTDDGLIHVTRDGGQNWANVTPPELTPWSKVAQLETSHWDDRACYAAINRIRLDDLKPYIYRTRDGGKTWQLVTAGIPANEPVNTVKEDPQRRGLLFAGTERSVYVSFDEGDHWQSLRQNLPATSIRDLVVHNDDLVVGTHGRGFWILDDITPLRQLTADVARSGAFLFKPQAAIRVRRSTNSDTPLPPEEPAGENPPDGAVLNYWLAKAADGPVTLEIVDEDGKVARRYSSAEEPAPVDEKKLREPTYWVEQPERLSAAAGMHRFVWDLHYPAPKLERDYPISAIEHRTPLEPKGPRAVPGEYTVRLIVGGQTYTQPLTVKMDPRVTDDENALRRMFSQEQQLALMAEENHKALEQVRSLRKQIAAVRPRAGAAGTALDELDGKLQRLEGGQNRRGGGGANPTTAGPSTAAPAAASLTSLSANLKSVYDAIDSADVRPTVAAGADLIGVGLKWRDVMQSWDAVRKSELVSVNAELKKAGLAELKVE
jgi:photosystem II stability/assembly factor-like uncharacterized protein